MSFRHSPRHSPMSFSWDCVREDFPKPCFAGTDMGNIKGNR